jgi:hypothetical protein
VNDTPPAGKSVVEVVGRFCGGLDVDGAETVVSVAAGVVDGTVLLEVVVGASAGSDVDVAAEDELVVDSTATVDTVASGEFPEPNNVRPPRMSNAVTTAATIPESHAARVPRTTSATSELAGAGRP